MSLKADPFVRKPLLHFFFFFCPGGAVMSAWKVLQGTPTGQVRITGWKLLQVSGQAILYEREKFAFEILKLTSAT